MVLLSLLLPPSFIACEKVEADRLYAVRLEAPPVEENWEGGLPLHLKAGGGNVHGRKSVLDRIDPETDPIHSSSASCHHGPPVTDPVPLEMRAFYDRSTLYIEVVWEDPTADVTPRRWQKGPEGWGVNFHEGDGLALLWSRQPGRYGCQEACHVDDWTVRTGSVLDVRSMYLEGEGAREEAWVWKAAEGSGELILDSGGFVTPAGESYRRPNSAAALDSSLAPEVRQARAFGRGDGPATGAAGGPVGDGEEAVPAYLYGRQSPEPLLSVKGRRRGGGWRVLFSRPLAAGEGRQAFAPGETYHFGVAVFDDTAVDHHIVRDTRTLILTLPPS